MSPLTRVASSMASRHRHSVREIPLILALYPVVIFGLAYRPFGELLLVAATIATLAVFIRRRRRHRPDPALPPPRLFSLHPAVGPAQAPAPQLLAPQPCLCRSCPSMWMPWLYFAGLKRSPPTASEGES